MKRRTFLMGGTLLAISAAFATDQSGDRQFQLPHGGQDAPRFVPPAESDIPEGPFGDVVRYGRDLYLDTQQLRGKYVANDMSCVNCHLDAGRRADSAPAWAAYPMYPAYRTKNAKINSMEDRIQGCFRYSMNGTPPPVGSKELTALVTYHYWMATGAPVGVPLEGRGYPELPEPKQKPDLRRGQQVYEAQCAICHGANGEGVKVDGKVVFPPLWGENSYNWGAGMHRINTAAAFIHANMPLGKPKSLSEQEAWDVAAFINSHERPQDPRHKGDVAQTRKVEHDHACYYGGEAHGQVLGVNSYPNPLARPGDPD